jgi:HEAT repeat protein
MTTDEINLSPELRKEIEGYIREIGSPNGSERAHARFELIKCGKIVTPFLIEALKDKNHQVRWEAAKAFGEIKDPAAADALVLGLMDDRPEIRWLAAEALIALEEDAIDPLLRALVDRFDSIWLRHGAHHVLHALERNFNLDRKTLEVLEAMRSIEPEVTVPWAAEAALEARSEGNLSHPKSSD